MTITAGIGGIQGSSTPGAPLSVVAAGGVEEATLSWVVGAAGSSAIESFQITPYLGSVALTPITVPVAAVGSALDPTPGATDTYTVTGLLVGAYSFTVAQTNASETGDATSSNTVNVVAPPVPVSVVTPIPHLAVPLQLGPGGSFNTVQQDTIDDVSQSVEVILGTTVGTRVQVPAFGVGPILFVETAPSAQTLTTAVQTWEPRAVVAITVTDGGSGLAAVNARVALAAGGGKSV